MFRVFFQHIFSGNSLKEKENFQRIDIITKERIVVELHKILESPKPSIGFLLLEKTGLLDIILPEITALKGIDEVEDSQLKEFEKLVAENFVDTLDDEVVEVVIVEALVSVVLMSFFDDSVIESV